MPGSRETVTHAWREHLESCAASARAAHTIVPQGRLIRVAGLVMEAIGLRLPVGSACLISQSDLPDAEAEVVGFSGDRLFLMPTSGIHGLAPGARVRQRPVYPAAPVFGRSARRIAAINPSTKHLPVGEGLLGRVLDGAGRPLDRLGPLRFEAQMPLWSQTINPIDREPIRRPLDVGVRAINALLTVGRGQRMGLFSGSGVGKSVLLGMMARYTAADVIVVGLIGERGREVKEFIEDILGREGLARAVVVAAPADSPPLLRLQGGAYATTIAEYFRDRGKHVLLIMDSLTRYAMAQREIGLAINEPPATRGYPPSVFAKLPELVERAGNGPPGGGSITAFYTVLTEGDDPQDPIGDSARAILDGHIVLSRQLADQGHYPAIDIEQSISRAQHALVKGRDYEPIKQFKASYARYQRNRDLVSVGAYVPGTDPALDQALVLYPRMEAFLQQDMNQKVDLATSVAGLRSIFAGAPNANAVPEGVV
jgi:flagellum-specific ATP synthase